MKELKFVYDGVSSVGAPFIAEDVDRAALIRMFEKAKERKVDLHAFQVWRDNELKVRMSLPPYDCLDRRQYYSLSKSFTATAIGLACDEGLLTTDTRIVDIFPDKVPATISENLAKCKVRHVLSMNSGKGKDSTQACFQSDDLPRAFMDDEFPYEPGTHFCYDTGATAMLAAIVTRVTGLSTLDYLDLKLFRYMDIRGIYWDRTTDGTVQAGTGLHASCDDAAKLGLLYLNRGMWNGRRLLSEAWIDEASTTHSDNRPNDMIDWESGYCYQFWTCSRGGYRGDGAFGQYCFILPEQGMVVSALCEAERLQNAVDVVHEMALEVFNDPASAGNVELAADEFYAVPKSEVPEFPMPRYFKIQENPYGLTYAKLDTIGDEFVFAISDGFSLTNIRCGNGKWIRNRASFEMLLTPGENPQTSERTDGMAAAYVAKGNEIRVELRCLYSPHHVTLTFTLGEQDVQMTLTGLRLGKLSDSVVVTGTEV